MLCTCRWWIPVLSIGLMATGSFAGELPDFKKMEIKGLTHTAIGVTRRDTPIDAYVCPEDTNYSTKKCRILLIGGLDGERKSVDAVMETLKWFQTHEDAADYHRTIALSAIACANPDGVLLDKGEENGAGGKPGTGYPPTGKYYQSETNVEAQYLWRWIQLHAPDIVVDIRAGKEKKWGVPKAINASWVRKLTTEGRVQPQIDISAEKESLAMALSNSAVALRLILGDAQPTDCIGGLLSRQSRGFLPFPSTLRSACTERLIPANWQSPQARFEPTEDQSYFNTLPALAYLRLGYHEVSGRYQDQWPEWCNNAFIRTHYLSAKPATIRSGSQLAGQLLLVEIAQGSHDPRLKLSKWKHDADFIKLREQTTARLRDVVSVCFDKGGKPLAEPPFHNQMSDAVFMNGPILSGVGKLTGEKKYFDACAQHVHFTLQLCKRDDGLYRHSPLCEAAWGRGNGFVAMGLALVLEEFDPKHPAYPELLKAYQEHLAVLKKHQDYTGCWHQVIDHPESYREFTCTCMIGFAMATGVRHGWLKKEEYQACVDKAWDAARVRVVDDRFMDVCTGTGKQKTLRDYFDREALFSQDDRAASMFLMFASER